MKRRINGAWVEKSPPRFGTAPDSFITFPATIYTDGTDATAYKIYGNLVQSSNPTTGTSPNIYPPIDDDSINRDRWGTDASGGLYGEPCYNTSRTWQGLCNAIYLDVGTYTFSIYMRAEEVTSDVRLYIQGNSGYTPSYTPFAETTNNRTDCDVTTSYRRFISTFEVTTAGYVYPRVEKAVDSGVNIYVTCFQLESGSTATAYSAYGSSVILPVYPQECGDCPVNIFNRSTNLVSVYASTPTISSSPNTLSVVIPVEPSTAYTFKKTAGNRNRFCETDTYPHDGDAVNNYVEADSDNVVVITTGSTTHYILWFVGYQQTYSTIVNTMEMYLGNVTYTCKLPIVSGGTTTDVYLNEPLRKIGDYTDYKSESVEYRAIKKLVLTGEENWTTYDGVDCTYRYILPSTGVATLGICSHFTSVTALARLTDGTFLRGGLNYLYIRYDTPEDVTAFKAFLTAQYNNGTPVCVWYVLATPTTESITAPEIPTTAGSQTFDVDTSLKPSKVELTYHGWHASKPKEYSSGQWT